MKWFLSLLAVALSVPAFAQNGPPAKASYVFNVSLGTWVADTTTTDAGVGDLPNAPPAAALYCLNTATNQWTPATTAGNCFGSSAGATWGSITGTLSSQTDLNTALSAKLPLAGGPMTGTLTGADGGTWSSSGISTNNVTSSSTLTAAAASFSGTATFNGSLIAHQPVLTPCTTGQYILAANSTSAPSVYNSGIYTDCTANIFLGYGGTSFLAMSTAGLSFVGGPGQMSPAADPTLLGIDANQLGSTAANGAWIGSEFISKGYQFTASGCSNGTLVGGSSAGSFVSGTSGTCTVTISMAGSAASFFPAPHGWSCWANDLTTPLDVQHQTATTTTTVTISGTTISGDVVNFGCMGY